MPGEAKTAAAPAAARTLRDCPSLLYAIEEFVRKNSDFASSAAVDAVVKAIAAEATLDEAYLVPLRSKIFSLDTTLRWLLFLAVGPEEGVKRGDPPLAAPLSEHSALVMAAKVYDLDVQRFIWDRFDQDEDSESESDDEAPASSRGGARPSAEHRSQGSA